MTIDDAIQFISSRQDHLKIHSNHMPILEKEPNVSLSTSDIVNSLKQHTLSDNNSFYGAVY